MLQHAPVHVPEVGCGFRRPKAVIVLCPKIGGKLPTLLRKIRNAQDEPAKKIPQAEAARQKSDFIEVPLIYPISYPCK